MISIYYESSCEKEPNNKIGICSGDFENLSYAFKLIRNWFNGQNIKAPYLHSWMNKNGHMVIDYGSHSKFIVLEEIKDAIT